MKSLPLALLVLLGGCAEDFGSVIILGNQSVTTCSVDPASDVWNPMGTLDVESIPGYTNTGYWVTLVLQNGTAAVEGDPNQNIFIVEGADVQLQPSTTTRSGEVIADIGAATGVQRTQRFGSSILPGGGAGGAIFLTIDYDQALAARDAMDPGEAVQILASTKVFGQIDGNDVQSNVFVFPITVCRGCLIRNLGDCSTVSSTPSTGGGCNMFQDVAIDCCTSGGANVCPATEPVTP
jgi:hypothetical protein